MSVTHLDRITRRFAEAYESAYETLVSGQRVGNDERRCRSSETLGEWIFACFTGAPSPVDSLPGLSRAARRRMLDFAREWEWRLTDGPSAHAREITPDVLGLVLEQRVNQRQTGSYYTRSDVTRYIAAATIVPALLDALSAHSTWESVLNSVCRLLAADPLKYVPPALARGVFAEESTSGPPELPGETAEEAIQRRTRCRVLVENLRTGQLGSTNDLVTWNVDLARLVCDLVADDKHSHRADVLWQVLVGQTGRPSGRTDAAPFRVLDPTCGSGAFLVAALEVLEPLYQVCAGKLSSRVNGDPGPAWIRRTILARNLYGVDLLPEAVAMCRLRLRLKVAAAESGRRAARRTATRLRDNVQVGDALTDDLQVARRAPSRKGQTNGAFHWQRAFPRVLARGGFDVVIGNPPYIEVASSPRANGSPQTAYEHFQLARTGNLFALCTERSLELLRPGGRLGVIVPMSAASTPRMRPLMELLALQLSPVWLSHFACRPGKLFVGVDMNVTIILGRRTEFYSVLPACASRRTTEQRNAPPQPQIHTTGYQRWPQPFRPFLFETLHYTPTTLLAERGTIPKLQSPFQRRLLEKLLAFAADGRLRAGDEHGGGTATETIYVHSGGRYFRKCLRQRLSNEYKPVHVPGGWSDAAVCLLSSSLFYWLWITLSDCYHVTDRDLRYMPWIESLAEDPELPRLGRWLTNDLWANSSTRSRRRADGSVQREINFDVSRSKPVLDEIDRALARHFGLTGTELEFIVQHDARYRAHCESTAQTSRQVA